MGPPAGVGPPGGMPDMAKMMEGMGKTPQKEIFPSMMGMPEATAEIRAALEARARERLGAGMELISAGVDQLSREAGGTNYAAMQEATAKMREGLARFDSGLAARRALAEGTPPKEVATRWFKDQMNLSSAEPPRPAAKMTLFHLAIMILLSLFAAAMIGMYFFKMRRATALLQGLTGGTPAISPTPATIKAPIAAAAPATASTVPPPPAAVQATGPTGKWSGKLRIGQILNETHNVKTFRMMDPLGGEIPFSFQPGQYLTLTVLPEGKPVRRGYTIASSPTEHGHIDLTIKREEKGVESRYLHDRVQAGDLLDVAGPSGSFVFTGRECKCLVFIAAGVGITPLMSVTRYLTARSWPGDIFLLYSCHSPGDFIFREELEFLQRRHPNLHVVVTVTITEGTDWKGAGGHITKELIAKSVPDIVSRRVHICGPNSMMEDTEKMLADLGVPKEQVKTEAFGPAIGKPEPEAKASGNAAAAPVADAKPAATPGAVASPTTPDAGAPTTAAITVMFQKSGKPASLPPEKSVLEASEDVGVNIPFECRVGTCGICKTKLISGEVTMAVQDALTPEDKAQNMILACQAKSTGNLVVEA